MKKKTIQLRKQNRKNLCRKIFDKVSIRKIYVAKSIFSELRLANIYVASFYTSINLWP